MLQKPLKWLKPWQMGTHLRVLSESYPMDTNLTRFRCFSKIFASLCYGRKLPQQWKGWNMSVMLYMPSGRVWYALSNEWSLVSPTHLFSSMFALTLVTRLILVWSAWPLLLENWPCPQIVAQHFRKSQIFDLHSLETKKKKLLSGEIKTPILGLRSLD